MNTKAWVGVFVIMALGRTPKYGIYERTVTSKILWRELLYRIVVPPVMTVMVRD
jgi:hypothetical protein